MWRKAQIRQNSNKATSGKTKVTAKKVTDKMSAEIGDKA